MRAWRIAKRFEGIEPFLTPKIVDGFEASGRHEPGARVGRHAVAWPLFERGTHGVVQRLLGSVEVADQANQRRKNATRFGLVDRLNLSVEVRTGHCLSRRN